jgi:hypothetical protein
LFSRGPHFNAEEMKEDALNMYKKEKLFYNPLLNPDDIVIENYNNDV